MKKIHYRNVGLPKTGTTWLWHQLMRNRNIDGNLNDYLKEFKVKTIDDYKRLYEKFDVSVNFNTQVFYISSNDFERPDRIHEYTTHITLSIRNPYEILDSMFNMRKNRKILNLDTKSAYTEVTSIIVERHSNFENIFDYWKSCKLDIKYMLYDDLVADPKKYTYDVCEYIGVTPSYTELGKILATVKEDPLIFDNQKTIDYINKNICVIEDRLNRDLSHWKR
jgi:hypothetical protein